MRFSRHRFTQTLADPLAAPATHEAAVIGEKPQQAQPDTATVQMARQCQAVAQPGVEISTSEMLLGVLCIACETAVQTP
jgi:hypothetical protein